MSAAPVSFPDSKARLADLVHEAVLKAFPDAGDVRVELDRPKSAEHGDFTTNVALQLAKRVGLKAREATLTVNVGFALTTVGARGEARLAIEGAMFRKACG